MEEKIIVSLHPRTRSRLDSRNLRLPLGVTVSPFGFIDYVCSQRNAFCVISDSGSISEEAAIMGFPAVNIRDALERHEALTEGTVPFCGTKSEDVMRGIEIAVSRKALGSN